MAPAKLFHVLTLAINQCPSYTCHCGMGCHALQACANWRAQDRVRSKLRGRLDRIEKLAALSYGIIAGEQDLYIDAKAPGDISGSRRIVLLVRVFLTSKAKKKLKPFHATVPFCGRATEA